MSNENKDDGAGLIAILLIILMFHTCGPCNIKNDGINEKLDIIIENQKNKKGMVNEK